MSTAGKRTRTKIRKWPPPLTHQSHRQCPRGRVESNGADRGGEKPKQQCSSQNVDSPTVLHVVIQNKTAKLTKLKLNIVCQRSLEIARNHHVGGGRRYFGGGEHCIPGRRSHQRPTGPYGEAAWAGGARCRAQRSTGLYCLLVQMLCTCTARLFAACCCTVAGLLLGALLVTCRLQVRERRPHQQDLRLGRDPQNPCAGSPSVLEKKVGIKIIEELRTDGR